jgi:6-phosphogluconolactonase
VTSTRRRDADPRELVLYIGCYTERLPYVAGAGPGLVVARFDERTGDLAVETVLREVRNPTFLALDREQQHLYAVNETEGFKGSSGGGVTALALDDVTGRPTLRSSAGSGGTYPCHLALTPSGRWLLTANFAQGTVGVLPVGAEGMLGPETSVVPHGELVRQPDDRKPSHPHMAQPDPPRSRVLVPDLGADLLAAYDLDEERGSLAWSGQLRLPSGSGPRHLALHPGGRTAFLVSELHGTVTRLDLEELACHETVSSLPASFAGANHAAAIALSPDGRFLLVTNRGHDSIAVFAVDQQTAALREVAWYPSGGAAPRDLAFSPSGRVAFCVNQDSDNVTALRVDPADGSLEPWKAVDVGTPASVAVRARRRT